VAAAPFAGCGCACDDIELTAAGPVRTCALGDAWFAERTGKRPPVATVEGRDASLDEAVEAAAAILRQARAPLVYGLGQTSCEAQRRAVALAEALGGVLDPAAGGTAGAAFQALGSSTATFGEIRDRAELVVVWRADPAVTNPRLLERLRLERATRGTRALVVVDEHRTATADEADSFVELDAADEFDALWALRAVVASAALDHGGRDGDPGPTDDSSADDSGPNDNASSDEPGPLDDLAGRLLAARHLAVLYGNEVEALALFALVRDLARDRHAVTLGLRRDGNGRGAEDVLAWQTGFPGPLSFARGHPREEVGAAALLERGDVDAALVIASDPLEHLTHAAADRLRALPTIVVDARATITSRAARVAFITAADGVEVQGTAHRMDGVPVPLRALHTAQRPSVEDVLAAIGARL
jgi:formylmethanofuran dehydrogenase subunit B